MKEHQYITMSHVLSAMTEEVRSVNVANGWYDADRDFGMEIALLHSEVSEMLEAYRDGGIGDQTRSPDTGCEPCIVGGFGDHSQHRPIKPEGVGSECADVLIRLLDTCKRYDIDLAHEFRRKLAYNATRGYKHGGKLA